MTTFFDGFIFKLAKTSYVKAQLNQLLLSTISVAFRIHLDILISYLIKTGYIVLDFPIQIFVSVFLIYHNNTINTMISRFENDTYPIARYVINNYDEHNYRRWKRNTNLFICLYFWIYLQFVDLTSTDLQIYIIQYIICYIIIDSIETESYKNYIQFYWRNRTSNSNNYTTNDEIDLPPTTSDWSHISDQMIDDELGIKRRCTDTDGTGESGGRES